MTQPTLFTCEMRCEGATAHLHTTALSPFIMLVVKVMTNAGFKMCYKAINRLHQDGTYHNISVTTEDWVASEGTHSPHEAHLGDEETTLHILYDDTFRARTDHSQFINTIGALFNGEG